MFYNSLIGVKDLGFQRKAILMHKHIYLSIKKCGKIRPWLKHHNHQKCNFASLSRLSLIIDGQLSIFYFLHSEDQFREPFIQGQKKLKQLNKISMIRKMVSDE